MAARKTAAKETAAKRIDAICFLSSGAPEANEALEKLVARYGNCPPEQADVIVALGGDGLMLQTLHRTMNAPKPIYGMNRGSVGFLMNEYSERGLRQRLAAARPSIIHPLADARAATSGGSKRRRAPSTKSRCCARPIRRPSSPSASTAPCGSAN